MSQGAPIAWYGLLLVLFSLGVVVYAADMDGSNAPSPSQQGPVVETRTFQREEVDYEARRKAIGLELVEIPSGAFEMGSLGGRRNERPVHLEYVNGFRMGKTEVTVGQYRACVQAKVCPETRGWSYWCDGYREGGVDYPMLCVNVKAAEAFTKWVGAALPTEVEWEFAARGTSGRLYPWGNKTPSCELAVFDASGVADPRRWGCGTGGPDRVCSRPGGNTPQGLCDMAGNAAELTSSQYTTDYFRDGSPGVTGVGVVPWFAGGSLWDVPPYQSWNVIRGGSSSDFAADLRSSARLHRAERVGFRVIVREAVVTAPPAEKRTYSSITGLGTVTSIQEQKLPSPTGAQIKRRRDMGLEVVHYPSGPLRLVTSSEERPGFPHQWVQLSAFDMGKTEVTVAQYRQCVLGGACTLPASNGSSSYCNWGREGRNSHPVNCITHLQAQQFATWLGGHLPTEAQWERVARDVPWYSGDGKSLGDIPCNYVNLDPYDQITRVAPTWDVVANHVGCGTGKTAPVCARPDSNANSGVCDLLGNVWEWTADWFSPTAFSDVKDGVLDPSGPPDGKLRTIRGGSFLDYEPYWFGAAGRDREDPEVGHASVGFRVVFTPEASASGAEPSSSARPGLHAIKSLDFAGRRDALGMEFVTYLPTSFVMGSDVGSREERPRHTVALGGFSVARTEVTVGQYRACVQAGECDGNIHMEYALDGDALPAYPDDFPVIDVTFDMAEQFARWVGGEIPTEAQWEFVARGTGGRRYPWGDSAPDCARAVFDDSVRGRPRRPGCGSGTPTRVCSHPAGNTPDGICDMAGNVMEWTRSPYSQNYYDLIQPHPLLLVSGPWSLIQSGGVGLRFVAGASNMVRGGGFADVSAEMRSSSRRIGSSSLRAGFRVVLGGSEVPPGESSDGEVHLPVGRPTHEQGTGNSRPCCTDSPSNEVALERQKRLGLIRVHQAPLSDVTVVVSGVGAPKESSSRVHVSEFDVTRTEITVDQYRACVLDGVCSSPQVVEGSALCNWGKAGRGNHPVNCVTYFQADTFAHWVGGSLPSDAQATYLLSTNKYRREECQDTIQDNYYERGYDMCDSSADDYRACRDVTDGVGHGFGSWGNGRGTTGPVSAIPKPGSEDAVCEVAGNVWEWTRDWNETGYVWDTIEGEVDPTGPDSGELKIIRGGSFVDEASVMDVARDKEDPSHAFPYVGFRVVFPTVPRAPESYTP